MMNVKEIMWLAEDEGMEASLACQPKPVVFAQAKNLLTNEIIPGTEQIIEDGLCGFAWVTILSKTPENKEFIKELKKAKLISGINEYPVRPWHKNIDGPGYKYWVGLNTQSVARKEAFAEAFADTLKKFGITAHVGSRLD